MCQSQTPRPPGVTDQDQDDWFGSDFTAFGPADRPRVEPHPASPGTVTRRVPSPGYCHQAGTVTRVPSPGAVGTRGAHSLLDAAGRSRTPRCDAAGRSSDAAGRRAVTQHDAARRGRTSRCDAQRAAVPLRCSPLRVDVCRITTERVLKGKAPSGTVSRAPRRVEAWRGWRPAPGDASLLTGRPVRVCSGGLGRTR